MQDKPALTPALEYFARALKISFGFLKFFILLILFYYLFSGIFSVKQDEVAVILRFGKIAGVGEKRVLKPGFHWAFPEPIDKVIKIPIKKIKTLTIEDFWNPDLDAKEKSKPPPFLVPWREGYAITGDINLIHMKWQVEYKITDPIAYIVNVKDEEKIVKDALCQAIIRTTATFNVDEALRAKLERLVEKTKVYANKKLKELDVGLEIVSLYLARSQPPLQVSEAFNKVIRAEQIKSAKINEAKGYANRVINTAKGEAAKIIASALTYKNEVVNQAKADAEYILKLTRRYSEGKDLDTYLDYFYQEKMEEILSRIKGKFILREPVPGRENELRLIIGREKWGGK
ncbi:MAG TPA: FtsH protease activity modulator HflK [bacterium]|nr:FtsH protease activity modulator HflK [bacterium]HEX68380.1 FtsH protease activity modulator HflK [bacterium]